MEIDEKNETLFGKMDVRQNVIQVFHFESADHL